MIKGMQFDCNYLPGMVCPGKPKQRLINRQLLRIMKLTAILLTVFFLQVKADGLTQTISFSGKDVPLQKVLEAIRKQSGYIFFYKENILQDAKPVTIAVKNVTVDEAVRQALKDQPFQYYITSKTVVISKKKETTKGENELAPEPPLIDIQGRVLNEKGEPVLASITVKGSTKGTTTNKDGWFALAGIEENAILIISGVGIETTEIKPEGKTQLEIAVKISVKALDDVQMIAYGSTTKRFSTGNISSVKSVDLEKQPVNNPLLALEGRVPGLFITQATGLPGSGVNVAIQGVNSINNGNDPFYVIDGVPYTSQLLTNNGSILGTSGTLGSSGNPLSFLNPADIESISILKDADATAIYGSRGANGVILITTKKGKVGQTRVDVNMQSGWGKVTRKLDLLNRQQYIEMRQEAKKNDNAAITATDYDINGFWDTTRSTDWQKELIGNTAHYTDIQTSVSGGNSNTQVLVGVGYHKETTVFPGDLSDQKGSLHFSINNVSTNQRFRMQLTGNYLEDNNHIISHDLTQEAVILAPDAPKIYNDDGSVNWMPDATGTSSWTNPLAYLNNKYKNKTRNLIGNAVVSYQVIPNLEIKSSFGYTNLQSNEIATYPLIARAPEFRQYIRRAATYSDNNYGSWIVEPQAHYKANFGASHLEALIGLTIQQNSSNGLMLRGLGYNSDPVLEDIKSAPTVIIDGTINSIYKYNALFGRLSYNLLDKYLVNLTARRDGSSRFGPHNQFHNFGAAGIGWIFSKENFIQKAFPFLSYGKITASYGTAGNDQIGDYQFMTLYSTPPSVGVPYQGATGLVPNGLSNPFLQWEETKKLHIGLDLGLFKDRIIITTGYFRNRSDNQLLNYNLPIQTGYPTIARNLPATVENSGWELVLNTTNIKTKDFSWSTNINVTLPKNQLLRFPGIESSGYSRLYVVGKPITIIKVYPFAGVNPSTGVYQFSDSKGNLTSSPDFSTDQTVLSNTSADLYGGIENSFRYRNFELDFLFQFVKRKGANYLFGNFMGAYVNTNQPTSVLQRWQKTGDIKSIQRYYSDFSLVEQTSNAQTSDAAYSDASFARLKNLSLSYNFPQSWYSKAKFRSVRLYLQAQNLLTITNYIGLDPETLSSTTLPPLKVMTVGLQLGF